MLVACCTRVLRHSLLVILVCYDTLPVVLVGYDARCVSYSLATTLVAHSTRCYDTRGLSYSFATILAACRNRCYDIVAGRTRLLRHSLPVVLVCYDARCVSYLFALTLVACHTRHNS